MHFQYGIAYETSLQLAQAQPLERIFSAASVLPGSKRGHEVVRQNVALNPSGRLQARML